MVLRPSRTTLGESFSEGARQLWLRLEKAGIEPAALATKLKVSRGTVWRVLVGDRRPGVGFAVALEKELGIAFADWTRKPARQFVLPSARPAA